MKTSEKFSHAIREPNSDPPELNISAVGLRALANIQINGKTKIAPTINRQMIETILLMRTLPIVMRFSLIIIHPLFLSRKLHSGNQHDDDEEDPGNS